MIDIDKIAGLACRKLVVYAAAVWNRKCSLQASWRPCEYLGQGFNWPVVNISSVYVIGIFGRSWQNRLVVCSTESEDFRTVHAAAPH